MKITPESKPISEIFPIEGRTIYRVPVYQRNYSWNPDNIEELFNDVWNEKPGYYVGNILVTSDDDEGDGYQYFSIVDGQQRLTTITLFYLALFDHLKKYEIEKIDEVIITSEYLKRKLRFDDYKTKLRLLDSDQELFVSHLNILDKQEVGRFGNRAFAKRYNFIVDLFEEEFDGYKDAITFYNKLNNVEILRITANDITDAFTVFSSINAKGMPLTLIDLMKSHYLGSATKDGVSQTEATKKWDELVNVFLDENDNSNANIITQFLLNNYDTFESSSSSSITKKSALKVYQSLFNKDNGHTLIDSLISHAHIFSFISPNVGISEQIYFDSEIVTKLEELQRLDSSQSYPLTLYLLNEYQENKVSKGDLLSVIGYLISFFVRRNIVLKPKSSNIRAKVIESVRELQSKEKDVSFVGQLGVIADKLGSISVKDEEFLSSLHEGVYDVSPQTVRYILISLERKYGKNYFNKQNPDNLDDYKLTKGNKKIPVWTLEHILPTTENLKYGWREIISPDNIDLYHYIQQEHMHKLGNLTLTGYNPEMSDKSFLDKRDFQEEGSKHNYTGLRTPLYINESIVDSDKFEVIEDKTKWEVNDIERRTAYLASEVVKIFKLDCVD